MTEPELDVDKDHADTKPTVFVEPDDSPMKSKEPKGKDENLRLLFIVILVVSVFVILYYATGLVGMNVDAGQ